MSRRPSPSLPERLQDEARFLRRWIDNPRLAGAITPSGTALAAAMARPVDPRRAGPVIELGPGTGPVTEALMRRGIAEERLVLVEYDPDFCRLLARRFPRATVVPGDAYQLDRALDGVLDRPAAAIVSSLPLLTRPARDRARLLLAALALMAPDAPFVQFTYGLASPVPRGLGLSARVSPPVWWNLPPARVWVYGRAADGASRASGRQHDQDIVGVVKARTGRIRDGLLGGKDRLFDAIEAQSGRLREDRRVLRTLQFIERIGVHIQGPDTHVEADAALRRRQRWSVGA